MDNIKEQERLRNRISELLTWNLYGNIEIVTDTSEYMNIYRGQVLRLENREFVVRGDVHEPRFGLQDQPKFWVKRAIDLESGKDKILKLVFHEEFIANIGPLRIRCCRDPEKESRVLDLVKGDGRFMQGFTLRDEKENCVRVIEFIKGSSIYEYIMDIDKPHEEYYYNDVPWILKNIIGCFEAIRYLHKNGYCHGDIRNDHIIIERDTKSYRWIDFDLQQDYSDFDIWSLGNILNFILGKGIRSFREVYNTDTYPEHVKWSLTESDASAFWKYRVINLKKLFPYISDKLNNTLLHFSVDTKNFYERIDQLIDDLGDAVSDLPDPN
ncbi:hypothetical protein ACFL7D_03160 [candidate division KSB1 bacterium]